MSITTIVVSATTGLASLLGGCVATDQPPVPSRSQCEAAEVHGDDMFGFDFVRATGRFGQPLSYGTWFHPNGGVFGYSLQEDANFIYSSPQCARNGATYGATSSQVSS